MQTILTQCPRCQTSFKVSDKQLAIASGMVRCGSCLDVFSAPDNRITIKQPVAAVLAPEHFPDDEPENEDSIQEQTTPATTPLNLEDTNSHYQETSLLTAFASFEPNYEATPNSSPDPAVDATTTSTASDPPAEYISDEEVEFVLDYEDDIPLGDMMLDDLQKDLLDPDALDVGIHDTGGDVQDSAQADTYNSDEVSLAGQEYGPRGAEETAYIHESAPEAASEPNPESGGQLSSVPAELRRTDYDDSGYSPHAEQPASGRGQDDAPTSGFAITPAEELAATDNDITVHEQRISSETDAENSEPGAITAGTPEIFAHIRVTASDDPENLDPENSFSAEDFPDEDDVDAPGFSALSADEMQEVELTAAAPPKPHTQRDKEELRQYLAELEDADALEPLPPTTMDAIEVDPLTFEVGHVFRKYVTTFGWFVLSTGLLAALVLQVVADNLEFMQRSPSYSRYLPVFCRVLDCPQPERVTAIESLNSQDLLVRSHPDVPDALEVSFIFSNDADMPQPFPLVELSFMDSNRRLMANRLLKPEEYLPPELAELDEMPASSSVQVMLEMVDPGSDAVNYEIGFRDPATETP